MPLSCRKDHQQVRLHRFDQIGEVEHNGLHIAVTIAADRLQDYGGSGQVQPSTEADESHSLIIARIDTHPGRVHSATTRHPTRAPDLCEMRREPRHRPNAEDR